MGIEILAPAGSPESIYAAVRCGANAVYVGGSRFSARANATNFTADELSAAVDYCHLHNVKIYQAVNTLVFDNELEDFLKAAKLSAEIGIDAFIVQDVGAAYMLKQALPDMKLNASTQMSIHTKQGAMLAKETGFSRVVLSRELSFDAIKEIASADIEVEAFIHGALCMSVSGQCYMSAMIGSRSADRGLCAQACRLPFSAIKGQDRNDLSLKDLSGIDFIPELEKAGVTSVKIEGRMKRAEYVAAAVSACRAKADGKEPDLDALRAVFSRSGFTDGYLTGKLGADMFGTRQKEDVVSAQSVLPKLAELYHRETKACTADFECIIKADEPVSLKMSADGAEVTVNGDVPQVAQNRPTDSAMIEKQLSKLGDTPYDFGRLEAQIDDGLIVPASALNALRRDAVEKMNELRIKSKRKPQRFEEINLNFPKLLNIKHKSFRARLYKAEQLSGVPSSFEIAFLPIDEILKNSPQSEVKLGAVLPRFVTDENTLSEKLEKLKALGITDVLCTNYAHIKLCRGDFVMHGDFGLNVTNSLTLKKYAEMGLADATASFEMKLPQISSLGDLLQYGIIGYGRLPLMLTRNCPVRQAVGGCKNCTGGLTDRTGRFFPVKCDGVSTEVLNSDVLVMSDRLNEVNCSFITLVFTDESPERIRQVCDCYKNNRKLDAENITRGLYYRGIL
ncbi:MAG: DUF3656 domain-containing protein [Oscillospiraceae bacterium]